MPPSSSPPSSPVILSATSQLDRVPLVDDLVSHARAVSGGGFDQETRDSFSGTLQRDSIEIFEAWSAASVELREAFFTPFEQDCQGHTSGQSPIHQTCSQELSKRQEKLRALMQLMREVLVTEVSEAAFAHFGKMTLAQCFGQKSLIQTKFESGRTRVPVLRLPHGVDGGKSFKLTRQLLHINMDGLCERCVAVFFCCILPRFHRYVKRSNGQVETPPQSPRRVIPGNSRLLPLPPAHARARARSLLGRSPKDSGNSRCRSQSDLTISDLDSSLLEFKALAEARGRSRSDICEVDLIGLPPTPEGQKVA
mmetsp:Transcript_17839/g.42048  ORF Transcript_17839/g.42048 Transcript_17839/m.42048 type:complete len:309 (+) Transcript_17839:76-1002(+)|eukprot:CAMPEP_0114547370 /NCGR_PEP_ID=MMETSP0114-20121206/4428_1 /TAXON_ID=31324 /ORGANISM="Goniomonas sp, Strain m" /LENGTH=308 /DNA_ID=CAMNT_0001731921 /DNA_START=63 /DNA_END=989 /DNA_ORIENTATION=+